MTPEKIDPVDRREFFNINGHTLTLVKNLQDEVEHLFKAVVGLVVMVFIETAFCLGLAVWLLTR